MPHLEHNTKYELNNGMAARTAGELNYLITVLLIKYFEMNGQRYQQINDVLGALDGAGKEFYRLVAIPYEEKKIKENGSAYEGMSI